MSNRLTATIDPASVAAARALAADRALNAIVSGNLPDADVLAADELLQSAYETVPTSPAGIAELADLALRVEDLDNAMREMLKSIRDGAHLLMK